jgi:hypothetical protein
MYIKSAGVTLYTPFFELNRNIDLEIDTNYDSGNPGAGLTYSRVAMYSPHFYNATASQLDSSAYRRVRFVNQGINLMVHDADVALGYPSFIDADAYATNTISLVNAPPILTVRAGYGQLAMRLSKGIFAAGRLVCAGSTPTDTGLSMIGGEYGGVAIIKATGHVSGSPTTTRSGIYRINYAYDVAGIASFSATCFDRHNGDITMSMHSMAEYRASGRSVYSARIVEIVQRPDRSALLIVEANGVVSSVEVDPPASQWSGAYLPYIERHGPQVGGFLALLGGRYMYSPHEPSEQGYEKVSALVGA